MSDKVIELMEAVETLKDHCKAPENCDHCMFQSHILPSGCKLTARPFRWNDKSLGTLVFPEEEDEDNSNSDHTDLSPSYDHCGDYDCKDPSRY